MTVMSYNNAMHYWSNTTASLTFGFPLALIIYLYSMFVALFLVLIVQFVDVQVEGNLNQLENQLTRKLE